MSCLSRDLIKWLQSLDLTIQIKNPKRDLSNGFAIAEIFSCYYPQDVETFSYENATGMARKEGEIGSYCLSSSRRNRFL